MNMRNGFIPAVSGDTEVVNEDLGLDLYSNFPDDVIEIPSGIGEKKRGRPKKDPTGVGMTPIIGTSSVELNHTQTNEPYRDLYKETDNIIRSTIGQIDQLTGEMKTDLDGVRSSKTLKRKYDYISMIAGTLGTMYNGKITAARELNNTITKCNEFELKRAKELNSASGANVSDEQRLAEMYSAFIGNPNPNGMSVLGPNTLAMTTPNMNIIRSDYIEPSNQYSGIDNGYLEYMQNMTPDQRLMSLENNPNVKQVVMVNQAQGTQVFQMMDMQTGEVVNGVPTLDSMFLQDTNLDFTTMIATNTNLNESYPIVFVGQKPMEIGY